MAEDPKRVILRMEDVYIYEYKTFLKENSRPPSCGGNVSALHIHRVIIREDCYTFFARGSKKWIFKGDLASFD